MFLCFELPLNSKSDFITGDSFDSDFYSFKASVEHRGLMLTKGLDGVGSSLIFGLGFEIEHFAICYIILLEKRSRFTNINLCLLKSNLTCGTESETSTFSGFGFNGSTKLKNLVLLSDNLFKFRSV